MFVHNKYSRYSVFYSYAARVAVLFMVLLLLSACATVEEKKQQFKVVISAIKVMDSTIMEQRYEVKLRIMNRSREAVTIDGMSFDIELNNKDFASGVSNDVVTIAPFSDALLKVNVSSTIFGILRQINHLNQNKSSSFSYEIMGYVYANGALWGIPFNESGEIDFNAPPR